MSLGSVRDLLRLIHRWRRLHHDFQFQLDFPHEKVHPYSGLGQPEIRVWVNDEIPIVCLIDSGATDIIVPFPPFDKRGYCLDQTRKKPVNTAKKGETIMAYPLAKPGNEVITVRLDCFGFARPAEVWCSEDSHAAVLGMPFLNHYAVLLEETHFHIFARDT